MFCYQCEETVKGTGCTVKGVCGKEDEIAGVRIARGAGRARTTVRPQAEYNGTGGPCPNGQGLNPEIFYNKPLMKK